MAPKKVLIVDDDVDLVRAWSVRLKASGYEVIFALDALTATMAARSEEPDLVLLDVGLPGGGGFEVMERLKRVARVGLTPVIVVTAGEAVDTREKALAAGAAAFFQKPVASHDLLSAMAAALEGPAGGSASREDEEDPGVAQWRNIG